MTNVSVEFIFMKVSHTLLKMRKGQNIWAKVLLSTVEGNKHEERVNSGYRSPRVEYIDVKKCVR